MATAIVPDYALGAHTASLGLAFAKPGALPAPFASGAFVGQHGSWNRRPPSGYKVIFVPFAGGRPAGDPVDVLTGFLDPDGNARGRPVGVAVDRAGALLVADDVGNRVWRVTAAPGNSEHRPTLSCPGRRNFSRAGAVSFGLGTLWALSPTAAAARAAIRAPGAVAAGPLPIPRLAAGG